MEKINGYTPEEIARDRKQTLIDEYNCCELKRAEIKRHASEIDNLRKLYNDNIIKYRIKSVDRVLDYILAKKITDPHRLDLLLCHCQNKLNGNIDGTELNLEEKETDKGAQE